MPWRVHTPVTGAAVYGGVGMGPQENAFRSGVDIIVATPGRLLDHFRNRVCETGPDWSTWSSTKPTGCWTWGSCRRSAASSAYLPSKRQTLFFSATMPPPIVTLAQRDAARRPSASQLQRQSAPAAGITQAVYPVPAELKAALLRRSCSTGGMMTQALVFTRTKHRANRLAESWCEAGSGPSGSTATASSRSAPRRWPDSRAGASRCSWRPTSPRAASTSTRWGTW